MSNQHNKLVLKHPNIIVSHASAVTSVTLFSNVVKIKILHGIGRGWKIVKLKNHNTNCKIEYSLSCDVKSPPLSQIVIPSSFSVWHATGSIWGVSWTEVCCSMQWVKVCYDGWWMSVKVWLCIPPHHTERERERSTPPTPHTHTDEQRERERGGGGGSWIHTIWQCSYHATWSWVHTAHLTLRDSPHLTF